MFKQAGLLFGLTEAALLLEGERLRREVMAGLGPPPYQLVPRYRVSLVVISYNEEKRIGNLLTSALNQTEPLAEIVVADCSDPGEGTPEIARQFGAQVLRVPYGNFSGSRNLGAAATSGDLIVFSDADDIWSPYYVESMVDLLESGAALAHSSFCISDSAFYNAWLFPQQLFKQQQPGRVIFMTGNIVTPRSVWRAVGGYDESISSGEDRDFGARVGALYGVNSVQRRGFLRATSARRFQTPAARKDWTLHPRNQVQ